MKKIIFYFPYYEECGVPVLFTRMSRWLSDNYGNQYDVYIADYKNGAMARNLTSQHNIHLIKADSKEGVVVNDGDILIMQSFTPYYWPHNLHVSAKAKVFFWTLHYRNLIPSVLPLPGLRELPFNHLWVFKFCLFFYKNLIQGICELVENMDDHKSFYYMDISTRWQTEMHMPIKINEPVDYLPVPTSDYKGSLKSSFTPGNVLHIAWLGRVENEKTNPLVYTMKKCAEYAQSRNQKAVFHIIGYGIDEEMINEMVIENDYFKKTECHTIPFSRLDSFLLKNIDFMFAMGTSALEAAKLGIPTVLLDCTTRTIVKDYVFKFIFEREGYDLTHVMSSRDFEPGNDTFDKCMDTVINNYSDVAKKCRKHFEDKHSLTSVGEKFVKILNEMDFTFDMIDPKVIQQPFLLRLYNKIRGLKIE